MTVVCATLYAVVGCYIFGPWWFGFFWDSGFKSVDYIAIGTRILLDQYFFLVICIVVGFFSLAFVVMAFPTRLFAFLDRFSKVILSACIAALVIASLVVYHTQGWAYAEAKNAFWPTDMGELAKKLRAGMDPPVIEPPIAFFYLNSQTVEALYGQLEPELEETSRDVKSSSELKGTAELAAGGGKVGVEGGKSGEQESRYDRSKFSTERKCLEVMKYVRKTWPASYYTNFWEWDLRRQAAELLGIATEDRVDPALFKPIEPISADPEELKRQGNKLWQESGAKMTSELSLIHGIVFVDGDFAKTVRGTDIVLTHNLSSGAKSPSVPQPKASFRVVVPAGGLRPVPQGAPLHFRVFGNVTKPLGKDGFVDVAPVAIF
jgi:hypothetical protein